jgi:uncharacterized protein YgbK (DUF1537 family)
VSYVKDRGEQMKTPVSWEQRLLKDNRRVVILDDDPTGTQTVADVEVIMHPSLDAYRQFFAGPDRAVYVLTNSRSLDREAATSLVARIRDEVKIAAQEAGAGVAFLLRGDSTLRGHVFAEIDVLAAGLENPVSLFVPAFPEGGRATIGGVHYLATTEGRVPVAQTEFARDTVFGYRSERIVDWVAEVGQGRRAISVPLELLRVEGPAAVTRALLDAPAGFVIVPDAVTRADLEIVAYGLLDAEALGRQVVVRTASTFAAIRAGLHSAHIESVDTVAGGRVLVVCGSHTAASSRQLDRLVERTLAPVIIPTGRLLSDGPDVIVPALAESVRGNLEREKFAILATERIRQVQHGDLATGARIMDALTAIVGRVADDCAAIIAKGGTTSAQVATDGLGATQARVRGQLEPGISLWDLTLPGGRRMPYAVTPGNVGNDRTLLHIATQFHAAPLTSHPGKE